MTVALYARRKQWPLQDVTVQLQHSRIHAADCVECETKEGMLDRIDRGDRKSTRLNSSHSQISYAVFCLKKKKSSHVACLGRLHILRESDVMRKSGGNSPRALCGVRADGRHVQFVVYVLLVHLLQDSHML